ncbi:MAG: DinB family protein [Candidatus Bathyarchaeota archaeon]|nr:DinB family protein [Candidatus Bathyarchaeota archaeon]
MGEIERIVDQLQRAFDGRAWHGPSVMALLSDVDADQAAVRPLKERHTIWELVLHINAWRDKVRRVLGGEEMESLPDEEDWPPVDDISEEAWARTVEELKRVHGVLIEAVSGFNESQLDETVPGASYSFYNMLHGLVQHDLYHAGQIAILKKK